MFSLLPGGRPLIISKLTSTSISFCLGGEYLLTFIISEIKNEKFQIINSLKTINFLKVNMTSEITILMEITIIKKTSERNSVALYCVANLSDI